MSKEYLESLKTLKDMLIGNGINDLINDYVDNLIKPIKSALQRLEAIDNANPSEALKELKRIDYNITYLLSDCDINEEVSMNFNSIRDNKSCEIIKQALLKAQEPKHYLKWEDLEFNIDKQIMTVLLNGTKYTLIAGRNVHIDKLAFLRNGEINYYFLEADKQFFNDLHLERVEEWKTIDLKQKKKR